MASKKRRRRKDCPSFSPDANLFTKYPVDRTFNIALQAWVAAGGVGRRFGINPEFEKWWNEMKQRDSWLRELIRRYGE